jgi:hypothetical protein
LADAFDEAWLESVRREVLLTNGRLSNFDADRQNRLVERFRAADEEHLSANPARVRRRVAEHAVEARNSHRDQDQLIRREANKKTRHLPLRELFEKAPEVLTAVKPCWAMSPLDVAQTLPPRPLFDLTIFDEGSQILPSDAIPALLRAPRALVAGDSRQLPPTSFFDGGGDDSETDEDEGGLAAFESILDVMDMLVSRRPLTWHYRSADERLIAFSNRNIYHGGLTTFPGAAGEGCMGFEPVDHRPEAPANTRSNPDEVRRVVDLMIDHARRRPTETLGVIAMGRYHADRIEEVLRRRLGELSSPALEEFFDESAPPTGNSARARAASGISQPVAGPTADPRGTPPRLPRNTPIAEHSRQSLVRLAEWVMSDGLLRTDEEVFEEMFEQLGYGRRGSRIKEALFAAIRSARDAAAGGRDGKDRP